MNKFIYIIISIICINISLNGIRFYYRDYFTPIGDRSLTGIIQNNIRILKSSENWRIYPLFRMKSLDILPELLNDKSRMIIANDNIKYILGIKSNKIIQDEERINIDINTKENNDYGNYMRIINKPWLIQQRWSGDFRDNIQKEDYNLNAMFYKNTKIPMFVMLNNNRKDDIIKLFIDNNNYLIVEGRLLHDD